MRKIFKGGPEKTIAGVKNAKGKLNRVDKGWEEKGIGG